MFVFNNKFRLCDLFGIPVYLDFSLVFLLLMFLSGSGSIESGFVCAFLLLFSIVVHELAHALAARAFGYATRDITLSLLGGCASLIALPRKAWQEFATAIAGPLASIALSLGGMALLSTVSVGGGFLDAAGAVAGDVLGSFGLDVSFGCGFYYLRENQAMVQIFFYLSSINLMLAAFNLLPGFPMDGGRIFRSAMRSFVSRTSATFAAMAVGRAVAVLIGLRGVLAIANGGNWGVVSLLIAYMIWKEGRREYEQVKREERCGSSWREWRARVSPPPYGGDGGEYDVEREF